MLITLQQDAKIPEVLRTLQSLGLWCQKFESQSGMTVLQIASHSSTVSLETLRSVPGVADVIQRPKAHPLVDELANTTVHVGSVSFGPGLPPLLIAGPCSVESEEQIHHAAQMVAQAGGKVLRGGAFKPRTSPYSFQGHGAQALTWLREAGEAEGLAVVTEVMSESTVDLVARHADILQVGSRNMQNYDLLHALGRSAKPVLLKRGMSAKVEEWLMAGEHLLASGASTVIFCERGIVSFDSNTRNLLDLGAVALLAINCRLPVIVDPSHALGRHDLVAPLARAALAAGAHGVMIEAHPDKRNALSDGPQALNSDALIRLGRSLLQETTTSAEKSQVPDQSIYAECDPRRMLHAS